MAHCPNMESKDIAVVMATEHVEDEKRGVVVETPAGRDFDIYVHKEDWKHAIKTNPKPIFWCAYVLFGVAMWGYDSLIGSVVIALPQFRADYGQPYNGDYVIPAQWQLAFTAGSTIGLLVGGVPATLAAKRWGRKPCLWIAYIFTFVGIFLQYYSQGSLSMYFGSKVLSGLPLATFATLGPTYSAEVAPLPLRGAMIAGVNLSIVIGQLIGVGAMRQTQAIPNSDSYRILFAVQWGLAAVGIILLPWLPESPYFYVAKGDMEMARKAILRLHGSDFDVEGNLASIQTSLESAKEKTGSFAQCFKGTNLKRTIIAVSGLFIQQNSGVQWVLGYLAYYLILAGVAPQSAFDTTLGMGGVAVIGNVLGCFLVEKVGRRPTAVYGCTILSISLFMIGILSVISTPGAIWAQVTFMAIWQLTYQSTIGVVAWPMVNEISTSLLRNHTQALATIVTSIFGIIWSFALPYIVNPDQANMGGKVAFIFGSIIAVSTVGVFLGYPETKGRTFAEIDALFEMKTSPRKFKDTTVVIVTDEK